MNVAIDDSGTGQRMSEAVKEDGREIILEVLGDCNSTFIIVEV